MIALAVTTVSAQEGGPGAQLPDAQAPVFSSRAELVVVHVTVTDRQGAYVTALPREAFRISEDGAPQRMNFFSGEDSPVTVGFLVDSSGSMREGRERVIAAATAFAEASNSQDEIFAIAFNEYVRPALPPSMPFTSDADVFRLALAGAMGAQGRTATFDHVLKEAQASNAAIYTVGIIDPLERDANPGLLRRLADATGGASFFPRGVDDVGDVLQKIADDIRHSYTLGYVSTNSARDGKFRRIRVVVNDPDRRSLRVRARDGYRAGEPLQGR
jgi:Ca-activated chloride channel homolog